MGNLNENELTKHSTKEQTMISFVLEANITWHMVQTYFYILLQGMLLHIHYLWLGLCSSSFIIN